MCNNTNMNAYINTEVNEILYLLETRERNTKKERVLFIVCCIYFKCFIINNE